MGQIKSCPQCGAALSETTLDGLCPACAAGAVLAFASGSPPGSPFPESGANAAGLRPTDFGEFELIEEIARGGMGVVYKARQKRLNRLVALKMILAGRFAGDEQVKRFRAEAEAAASLRHPNIVAIHDVSEVAGQHYFCMDLIEGPNLNGLVRDRPLSHKQAARLLIDVALAVQYAHERGVVHRDLKPSNIIIDQAGRPHVTDFGLAKRFGVRQSSGAVNPGKRADDELSSTTATPQESARGLAQSKTSRTSDDDLTHSGQMLGSPSFAAPEQAGGRTHEVGPRSDVYSLGAILYYLLVGRPPFQAESIEQTLSMVAVNDPVPPRKLDPGVPRDLETICLKCLEKEPGKRYATAGLLADELGRCLRGEPIRARPVGPMSRLGRWCRRKPVVAGLVATVVLAVVMGFTGISWQWRRAENLARSESAERGRAEEALSRLEWQRVEDLLQKEQAAEALAHLAHMHRKNPTNEAAAVRIVSLLNQRSFALPSAPPMPHAGFVVSADFSPDGAWMVTASWDKTARVWDTRTGRPVTGPLQHGGAVATACFSPDGRRVVTASFDRSARVWDASSGEPLTPPLLHDDAVVSARFSPDGLKVVTASKDQKARMWSATDGRPLGDPIQHRAELVDATFAPDGQSVLSASGLDGRVLVSDAASGGIRRQFRFNMVVNSARFSPDGSRIAVATRGGFARIHDVASGNVIATLQHRGLVHDAAFSPDGELLATVSSDRRALLWDAWTGDLLAEMGGHQTGVDSVEFTPDGLWLLTRETGHRAFVWDVLTGRPVTQPIQASGLPYVARFSPDGQRVAVAGIDGAAQLWGVAPGAAQPVALVHSNKLVSLQVSPDGQKVAGGHADGRLIVWNVHTGEPERVFQQTSAVADVQFSSNGASLLSVSGDDTATVWHFQAGHHVTVRETGVRRAQLSPDGKSFLTVARGAVRIWAADTGQPMNSEPIQPGTTTIWHAEFSPDGRLIATASGNYTGRLWDARTGQARSPTLEHRRGVRYISFNADGTRVVTASRDYTAAVWSVQTGERLVELAHKGQLHSARFSPDGRWVVTASFDNTARVWDAATGTPVTEPLRHNAEVQSAEFSPDGRWVVTASLDGTARVWDAQSGKPAMEPLEHHDGVFAARFTGDGRRLVTGARWARVWELPSLTLPVPDWLPSLAEGVGGQKLNESGRLEPIPVDGIIALKQALQQSQRSDTWTAWAQWFFSDHFTRSVSPGHPVSVGEMARRSIGNDSIEGGQEAVRLAPTNGLAWARLALLMADLPDSDDPLRPAQALLYSRRALNLSPHEPEVWLARARILTRRSRPDEALMVLARGVGRHPQHLSLWQTRAELLQQEGKLDEAYTALTRVIDLSNEVKPSPVPMLRRQRRQIGFRLNRVQEAQRDWLLAASVPARSTNCPPQCIDLTAHYSAALHEPWHDRKRPGNDLSQVPPGRFVARQIEFDVRGIVQLGGTSLDRIEPGFPKAANGIAVGRSCDKLHFLHAAAWGFTVADDAPVGRYVVHYADGETETVLLKKNVDLHEWFQQDPAPLADLAGARTIDLGRNAAKIRIRLFLKTWQNQRPAVPIATIDFVSEMTTAAPFLVALTVEP